MKTFRKSVGIVLGIIAGAALLMALETDIRKHTVYGGRERDVAMALSWISWGTCIGARLLCRAVWPKNKA